MKLFTSFIAPHVETFIRFRKASENWSNTYEVVLHNFDYYCATHYPKTHDLTQEIVDKWCRQRETESANSCRVRIFAISSFLCHLRTRGIIDIHPPELPLRDRRTYIPHAFTEHELENFFRVCDGLPGGNTLYDKSQKITIPVFFRLLYSSGIRTVEARLLRTENVDLKYGRLDIRHSKGHKQHYVALHDTMTQLLRQYDAAISKLFTNREYFFPDANDKALTHAWILWNFTKLWSKANSTVYAVPYDLRHHYAICNINRWIGLGFDFDDKLLYLSKSMGHHDIENTKYYYSLVPGLADILEEMTNADFEDIVPEVKYAEVE